MAYGWAKNQKAEKMFKAIVLACLVSNPNMCWEYHDRRGPYDTYEMCQSRAYQMSNDIGLVHEGTMMPKYFKCVQLKGTSL